MSVCNRFGAVYTDVLAEFPGAAAADFAGPSGTDGQARIESALDAAEQLVLAALPPEARRRLERVEGVELVGSAAAGQTAATLPLSCASTPDVVLWRGWPRRYWPALPGRAAALPETTAWTRSGQNLTLQAGWELAAGENLLAAWSHAAASSDPYLAALAVGLARWLLAARVFRPGEAGFQAADARRAACAEELARLGAGQARIPALGRLTFVADGAPAPVLGRA